jgi:hypothetical protein
MMRYFFALSFRTQPTIDHSSEICGITALIHNEDSYFCERSEGGGAKVRIAIFECGSCGLIKPLQIKDIGHDTIATCTHDGRLEIRKPELERFCVVYAFIFYRDHGPIGEWVSSVKGWLYRFFDGSGEGQERI